MARTETGIHHRLRCFPHPLPATPGTVSYTHLKDLTHVKSKVLFGLTKRQLVCFGGALLTGGPLYFLTRNYLSNSAAALLMIFAMLPGLLFALFERCLLYTSHHPPAAGKADAGSAGHAGCKPPHQPRHQHRAAGQLRRFQPIDFISLCCGISTKMKYDTIPRNFQKSC